ncbi:MAG: B12-binding domain-containing radical SAM protein [Candidatus Tectomicrobia bacterium]|uniref:B12-binding domain-containing radical SAM protein n=1 Tax=Tectimicrobiota bacterium TaxID=2528274 RepID=A0A937VXI7_UNCTE|nr:B12-binding domain-containing radical SAM protein [Candidatus Tectomicrobia bacterium]
MKILLIQPPVQDFYQTPLRTLPVGLLYLAAALREAGIEVDILDCQATLDTKVLPVPREFAYLKQYYQPGNLSPFKLFGHYRHYGLGWEAIRERIQQAQADVIGISALFTPFYREALQVAALAKAANPTRPVIMGGAHVNACPAQVLADPHVDFVVLGEGERTLPALVHALADNRLAAISRICGVGYKAQGQLRLPERGDLIEDLDTLPLPARDLIDPTRYTLGGKRVTMLITSRGCPYHCTFCSIFLTAGRQFRTRALPSILAEMRLCRTQFGTEIFDIEDDNFSFDQPRAVALLEAIRGEFWDGAVELLAMNGISAANISPELVGLMQRTGFRALNLALVTSDRTRQKATRRPGSTPHFDRVVQQAATVGLEMVNYLILGLPDSRLEEMLASMLHLMERPVLIGPSVFYATPGTASYHQCQEQGLLQSPELALQRSTCFPVETPYCSRLDLVTLFRLCRLLNVIKARLDAQPGTTEAYPWEQLIACAILPAATPRPDTHYTFPRKLTPDEIGSWLLRAWQHDGQLLGMRLARRTPEHVRYQVYAEAVSPAVLQAFRTQADGRLVYGVKRPYAWTRLPLPQIQAHS